MFRIIRNYIATTWYLLSAIFDNPSNISILIEPKELVSMYLFLQFGPKTGKMSAINQIIISDKKSGGRFSTLSQLLVTAGYLFLGAKP